MTDRQGFDPFAGGALSHTAPLTPEQEEIWLSVQLGGAPASLAYNEALSIELDGDLDRPALARAVDRLVQRHEALRSTLSGDGTTLCVADEGSLPVVERDLSRLEPDLCKQAIEQARREAVTEPFDLVRGPLARAALLRVDDRRNVLLFVAHHIVCDGWSGAILVRDLGRLYAAERDGRHADLPAATPFSAYALGRREEARSDAARAAQGYWLERFRRVPPPLELPLEAPRPAMRSFEADRLDVELGADLVQQLKSTAARHGASLVGVLLAGFQALLQRLSGQSSVVVGLPVAGQSFTGDTTLVGHCVRTLPLVAAPDPAAPFTTHLAATRTALLDAYDHAELTFGTLIKDLALPRDPSRVPLVSVLFNVDQDVADPDFGGLRVHVESVPRAYENFEIFVNGTFRSGALVLETTYSTTLFTRDSIARRMAEYRVLLEDVVADPKRSIGDLALMPPEERASVTAHERGAALDVPERTLCAMVREWAAREPERTAVGSADRSLSYAELDRRAGALAAELAAKGVGPGAHVGVCLSRSADLVVALLGILRSGAAYVPLDPEYPREHLEYVSRDAELAALVSEAALSDHIPAGSVVVLVDSARSEGTLDRSELASAAYVLYTSGSTGRPKGVVVEHRNLSHFVAAMHAEPGLGSGDVFVALTTPSFDISVLELLVPLALGARVVVATTDDVSDGRRLEALLASSKATYLQATPAGYRALIESGWESSPPELTLLCGGEALSAELAAALGRRSARLWNCYGPTETTIWSTIERIDGSPVTIGHPLANTSTYVLDERLRRVAPGVVGELYIAGAGVARGYLRRPELTAERFVADPFAGNGARMYKTGDRVRRRWDGRLEWLGRNDSQVKVRGHRIELGEIEARLSEQPGVREAVAVVREDRPGDQRIVAYVRPVRETELDERALGEALRRQVPAYMIPQHYVQLGAFPLTPNGKVDRRALPPPNATAGALYRAPVKDVERRLADEMFELLGARMGLDDDFFALGGHSLLALELGTRIRKIWGIEMPMRVVFANATLEALADFVQAAVDVKAVAVAAPSIDASDREEFTL